MIWIGSSWEVMDGDTQPITRIARVFVALGKGLDNLRASYNKLPAYHHSDNPPLCLRRFFPYPTYFLEDGERIYFDYIQALEDNHKNRCVTFLAKIQGVTGPKIVVKFVARYGKDVHKFLATKGYAPKLRYCGRLLGEDDDDDCGGDLPPGTEELFRGLAVAPTMMMIVMDFVERGEGPAPRDPREQVKQVLTTLHCKGYVFGDLREGNILLDLDGRVKLVDFDLAGRYDMSIQDEGLPSDLQATITHKAGDIMEQAANATFVLYPFDMPRKVDWADGMDSFEPIRPRHDWDMLDKISYLG